MEKMKCLWCGKEFERTIHNRKYCCTEHQLKALAEQKKAAKKAYRQKHKPKKPDKLGQDIKEARAQGLTYGQYQAKKLVAEFGHVNVADIMAELEGGDEGSRKDSAAPCTEGADSVGDSQGTGRTEKSDLCDTAEGE